MTSHEDIRKDRINKLVSTLNGCKDPQIDKLISISCIEWGTTPKTVKSYIKLIEDAGLWARK